jgi:hypothetical protein
MIVWSALKKDEKSETSKNRPQFSLGNQIKVNVEI